MASFDYAQDGVCALCGRSFPFDSCRGFAGDVVNDAVYAADFVYYAIGYIAEDFIRDFREIGGLVKERGSRLSKFLFGYKFIFFRMLDDAEGKVYIEAWPVEMPFM